MTTTINHVANGRRPNLGEQINRLDKILDGLSEGLNDAIVDAVKTSVGAVVKETVQAVLLEVFSNPEVLAKIQAARCDETSKLTESVVAAPNTEPELPPRGCFQRAAGYLGEMQQGCGRRLKTAGSMAAHLWQVCLGPFQATLDWCNQVRKSHGRTILMVAVGVGVALAAWFASPWIKSNAGVVVEYAASVIANLGAEELPSRRHRPC
jgi:hypothetical protein